MSVLWIFNDFYGGYLLRFYWSEMWNVVIWDSTSKISDLKSSDEHFKTYTSNHVPIAMILGTKVGRRGLQNRDRLGVHNSKFIIGFMMLKQKQTSWLGL
jgi:hypothetical protein